MTKSKYILIIFALILIPDTSNAVVSPDFLVQVGSSLGIILSTIGVIFATGFGFVTGLFQRLFCKLGIKKNLTKVVVVIVIIASTVLVAGYVLFQYREHVRIKKEETYTRDSLRSFLPEVEKHDFQGSKDLSSSVSTKDFFEIVENLGEVVLLDIREGPEVEAGFLPGSKYVRFADVFSGGWKELDKEKEFYVLCWSGLRGKIVADFLVKKGMKAYFLENGISGWYFQGGSFVGDIYLQSSYPDPIHSYEITSEEASELVGNGAYVLDSRSDGSFVSDHIAGSSYATTLGVPTKDLEDAYKNIPKNKEVILVCNNLVSCFDARITGMELANRGYHYVGRVSISNSKELSHVSKTSRD